MIFFGSAITHLRHFSKPKIKSSACSDPVSARLRGASIPMMNKSPQQLQRIPLSREAL
jgi:hypothetical protein